MSDGEISGFTKLINQKRQGGPPRSRQQPGLPTFALGGLPKTPKWRQEASEQPSISRYLPRIRQAAPKKEMGPEVYQAFDQAREEISALSTDLEVWEYAQRHVFPKIADATKTPPTYDIAASYPLTLTHLITLFRDQFDNPHLSLATFAHAKSHSLHSYVSGCSTDAYNQVMKTHWEKFRNLKQVEDCVGEMAMNGVGWDRNTLKVLSSIVQELTASMLTTPSRDNAFDMFGTPAAEHDDALSLDDASLTPQQRMDKTQQRLELEFGHQFMDRLSGLEARVEQTVASQEHWAQVVRSSRFHSPSARDDQDEPFSSRRNESRPSSRLSESSNESPNESPDESRPRKRVPFGLSASKSFADNHYHYYEKDAPKSQDESGDSDPRRPRQSLFGDNSYIQR